MNFRFDSDFGMETNPRVIDLSSFSPNIVQNKRNDNNNNGYNNNGCNNNGYNNNYNKNNDVNNKFNNNNDSNKNDDKYNLTNELPQSKADEGWPFDLGFTMITKNPWSTKESNDDKNNEINKNEDNYNYCVYKIL